MAIEKPHTQFAVHVLIRSQQNHKDFAHTHIDSMHRINNRMNHNAPKVNLLQSLRSQQVPVAHQFPDGKNRRKRIEIHHEHIRRTAGKFCLFFGISCPVTITRLWTYGMQTHANDGYIIEFKSHTGNLRRFDATRTKCPLGTIHGVNVSST